MNRLNEVQKRLVENMALALIDPTCPHITTPSYEQALDIAYFQMTGQQRGEAAKAVPA